MLYFIEKNIYNVQCVNKNKSMDHRERVRAIIEGKVMKSYRYGGEEPEEREAKTPVVGEIIKKKYRTFTRWNFRDSLPTPREKNLSHKKSNDSVLNNSSFRINLNTIKTKDKNQQNNNNSQGTIIPELMGVKSERRERFKKYKHPAQFIKHYIEKENFQPREEQTELIEKLIALQKWISNSQHLDLDKILEKIYKLMNIAVDYNQMQFLLLLILLTGDICFFLKDMSRSFFFFNQARIAGSYAHVDRIKMESIMGMGKVAFDLQEYDKAMRIFKKTLQYAWKVDNQEIELQIYDYFGQCLFYQGKIKQSQYYHIRYSQNQYEEKDSALKRISKEMLEEYEKYIKSLEQQNLDTLFISYLDLPITDLEHVGLGNKKNKKYPNYDQKGNSPRSKKNHKDFSFPTFLNVKTQLKSFLNEDYEFTTEIPFPDSHRNFLSLQKYGKIKNSLDFEHSLEFNRIIGPKKDKPDLQNVLKKPLEKEIESKMKEKVDPFWWQNMVSGTLKRRREKVGNLKQRVRNSHLSYNKYPLQRKKSAVWGNEKINESFNKTILDWIDPIS